MSYQRQSGNPYNNDGSFERRGGYQQNGNQGRQNNSNFRVNFGRQENNGGDNRNGNGNWNKNINNALQDTGVGGGSVFPSNTPNNNYGNGPQQYNQGQTNNLNNSNVRVPFYNNNNNNKDGYAQNFNNRRKVLNVINKIQIKENFSNCFLLHPENNQNQQIGVANRNEKVQIVLSSEDKYQNFLAQKQEQGLTLLGSSVLSSEKQQLKIEGCFVIKNPIDKNQELSVLSIQDSVSNLFGISIITSSPNEPHFLINPHPYQVAHKGPILQVLSFENWIVTVADNDDVSIKFWNIGQYNTQIDENITQRFNQNFKTVLQENNIQPSPIKCLEIVQSNGAIIVLVSFKFINNQSQNQNGTIAPSQNSLFCFTMDQQLKLTLYKKIDVGPTTSSILQMKTIFLNNNCYVFVMQSNYAQRDNNETEVNTQPAKGFIQLIKNFQTVFEVYQDKFNINDFVIVQSKEKSPTIIAASRQSIQPITWIPETDEFKQHQGDSYTLKEFGDVQKIHLFKNVINLVEINEILAIHYPKDKNPGSMNRSITLSSLQILDKPTNFANNNQDNENPNPFAQGGNNNKGGQQNFNGYKGRYNNQYGNNRRN